MAFRFAAPALIALVACSHDPDPTPSVIITTGLGGSSGGAGHAGATSGHGGSAGHAGQPVAGASGGGGISGSSGQAGAGPAGAGGGAGSAGADAAGAAGGDAGGSAGGDAGGSAGAAGATTVPVCGNGVVEDGEVCDEVSTKCVGCQIPCTKEGGHTCGGNGIPGSPNVLFVCQGGTQVVEQDCGTTCEKQPAGVPDRCPAPASMCGAPAGLVAALGAKPYVEQSCQSTSWPGWPYEAKTCSYSSGGLSATVTTANPSADRVACWVVDSASQIPALAALRQSDPTSWEAALVKIAKTTVVFQSSRIFPLEGGVIEDQGSGYVNYQFFKGVTKTCSTGCYCRVNSLHRTEWCTYVASTGGNYDACIDQLGTKGLTDAWGEQCLQNHVDAWTSNSNAHFRAKAYVLNKTVAKTCPAAGSCTGTQVLSAIDAALK